MCYRYNFYSFPVLKGSHRSAIVWRLGNLVDSSARPATEPSGCMAQIQLLLSSGDRSLPAFTVSANSKRCNISDLLSRTNFYVRWNPKDGLVLGLSPLQQTRSCQSSSNENVCFGTLMRVCMCMTYINLKSFKSKSLPNDVCGMATSLARTWRASSRPT